jgi:hypothetical protein
MPYVRKIKCPIHFVLRPGFPPFEMVPNPLLKNVSERAIKEFGLRRFIIKLDKWGRKVRCRSSYYQPEVTATWAIEHCYDPHNWICVNECKKRCFGEGLGKVNERAIGRLTGSGRYHG